MPNEHELTIHEQAGLRDFAARFSPDSQGTIREDEKFPPVGLPIIGEGVAGKLAALYRVDGQFESDIAARGWENPEIEHPHAARYRLTEETYSYFSDVDHVGFPEKLDEWTRKQFSLQRDRNAAAVGAAVIMRAFDAQANGDVLFAIKQIPQHVWLKAFSDAGSVGSDTGSIIMRNKNKARIPEFQFNLVRLIGLIGKYTSPANTERESFLAGARTMYGVLEKVWDDKFVEMMYQEQ